MLTTEHFADYFAAVHGHEPFPWQERLAKQVLDRHRWPVKLDLPTGAGKTAALDIAVFTLAAAAEQARPPRRIVLVVDRRVVVDQAHERADRLARTLAWANKDLTEPTGRRRELARRAVRDALLGIGGGVPLQVSVLRGGIPRDDSWAARPDQPTILLSTVDQVGSRLLFRGYGVTASMRPVHAGLLGTDTLFLLDEVHLSRPLADTLADVERHGNQGIEAVGRRPWQVVHMSATPGNEAVGSFRLDERDRDLELAPSLAQRLAATKQARLVDLGGAGPPEKVLPDVVARHLDDLDEAAVAVVVNRVATARAVAARLRDCTPVLLTGRMRGLDRDDVVDGCRDRMVAGRTRSDEDERLVVVATQSIEAGADLDFDAMVTECAPLDSLRQRFGRLDRLGELAAEGHPAQVLVLAPKAMVAGRDPDPVYGNAVRETYGFLKRQHGKNIFDVGPESVDLPEGAGPQVYAPRKQGPRLLPTHLDMLVQTSPRPHADQPVAGWLHGFDISDTDVTVAWRADLTEWHLARQRDVERQSADTAEDERPATDVVAACPPSVAESMQVPLSAVRAWLLEEAEVAVADIEGVPQADASGRERGRLVLRWRGADDSTVVFARTLRPGDTVLVPAGYGGISDGNWDPGSRSRVTDLGDRAQLARGRMVTLRIHPDVLPEGAPPLEVTPETDQDDLGDRLEKWLQTVAEGDNGHLPKWFQDAATALVGPLRSRLRQRWAPRGDNAFYLVLSARAGRAWRRHVSVDDLDGSDLTNSFTGPDEPVVLWDHLRGVGELAAEFGRRCGVPDAVAADLRLAGQLHDLGKADPRFQRWLHGGDEIRALAADDLIAKSAGDAQDPVARHRARQASRYPEDARHELLSVALVQEVPEVAARANDWDLVLHLVASHHGNCRPLAPVVRDRYPEDVAVDLGRLWGGSELWVKASTEHRLERIGSGVTDRFWRLVRAYGWWGLAWLEALLRLADHVQSQREREAREEASHA